MIGQPAGDGSKSRSAEARLDVFGAQSCTGLAIVRSTVDTECTFVRERA